MPPIPDGLTEREQEIWWHAKKGAYQATHMELLETISRLRERLEIATEALEGVWHEGVCAGALKEQVRAALEKIHVKKEA